MRAAISSSAVGAVGAIGAVVEVGDVESVEPVGAGGAVEAVEGASTAAGVRFRARLEEGAGEDKVPPGAVVGAGMRLADVLSTTEDDVASAASTASAFLDLGAFVFFSTSVPVLPISPTTLSSPLDPRSPACVRPPPPPPCPNLICNSSHSLFRISLARFASLALRFLFVFFVDDLPWPGGTQPPGGGMGDVRVGGGKCGREHECESGSGSEDGGGSGKAGV